MSDQAAERGSGRWEGARECGFLGVAGLVLLCPCSTRISVMHGRYGHSWLAGVLVSLPLCPLT